MKTSLFFVGEALGLSLPANNQTRSSERFRTLRARWTRESVRLQSAHDRRQGIDDYVESLRDLSDLGSDFVSRYPSVVANMARAAADEDVRIVAIRGRMRALDAQMRGAR
jgi:hypothetical protein